MQPDVPLLVENVLRSLSTAWRFLSFLTLGVAPFNGGWTLSQAETQPPSAVDSLPAAPPPVPQAPSSSTSSAAPLRLDPEGLGPVTPPRRFDQSLDDLVRQRIVSPHERDLIRAGGSVSQPFDVGRFQEACRSGALSEQECRGGVAVRSQLRIHGAETSDGLDVGTGRLAPDGTPLPPITVPVSALLAANDGTFNLATVFRVTPRPAPTAGNGNRRLLLPILGAAEPSSGFGWRQHPLLGVWRMHTGQDLAAPEGTPVVAALSGRVVSSGLAGGYGLAVEIEHQSPRRRTLYGHLSELFVRRGEWVRQGDVIGRVGSTGLSTGPHLHFELRQPADGGWVAVDPGDFDAGSLKPGSPDVIAILIGQLLSSLKR